jgi:hypothetical protein
VVSGRIEMSAVAVSMEEFLRWLPLPRADAQDFERFSEEEATLFLLRRFSGFCDRGPDWQQALVLATRPEFS